MFRYQFVTFPSPLQLNWDFAPFPIYMLSLARTCRSHLQPLVSASVACMKGDIKEAVYNFVTCNWSETDGRRDTMVNSDGDDFNDNEKRAPPTTSTIVEAPNENSSKRSNRARRSSVFNSFLSWKATPTSIRGSLANAGPNANSPRKAPMPTISSSGMISEAARSNVADEDFFVHDEDAEKEEARDDNV
jgi:hypothetical protein